MGERSWNWDLLRLPIFKILSIREAFWGHTLLVKVPLGKNSLTHSLMPWRVEWCDSGLEWFQLVDVQIFDSFYQLLTALPNLPNQTWQIKITKPTQTKHKKSNLPNQTQQSWTLNWWLSWNTQKAQELNPWVRYAFDNVCCHKCSWSLGWLVCLSWHWPGLPLGYSVRKIISHIRGRQICQSAMFSRYCQGVLVPGTVCQVTGNYLIFLSILYF